MGSAATSKRNTPFSGAAFAASAKPHTSSAPASAHAALRSSTFPEPVANSGASPYDTPATPPEPNRNRQALRRKAPRRPRTPLPAHLSPARRTTRPRQPPQCRNTRRAEVERHQQGRSKPRCDTQPASGHRRHAANRLLERRAARQNEIAQSRILALPSAYRNGNVEAWEHALRAFGIARPSKNLGSAGHERSDLTSLDALHQIEQRSSFHARKRGPSVSTRHETPVSRAILVFGAASGVVRAAASQEVSGTTNVPPATLYAPRRALSAQTTRAVSAALPKRSEPGQDASIAHAGAAAHSRAKNASTSASDAPVLRAAQAGVHDASDSLHASSPSTHAEAPSASSPSRTSAAAPARSKAASVPGSTAPTHRQRASRREPSHRRARPRRLFRELR